MKHWLFILLLSLVIGSGLYFEKSELLTLTHDVIQYIHNLGWLGFVVFILTHSLAVSACFPATILFELSAGLVFGTLPGILVVSLSKAIGAAVGFTLGRTLLHSWVVKIMKGDEGEAKTGKWSFIYDEIGEDGFRFALLLRLSPVPSWVNNYGLSLTTISFRDFVLATAAGSLPFIVNNVLLGSSLASLAEFITHTTIAATDEEDGEPKDESISWRKMLFVGLSLCSSILITRFIMSTVERAKEKHKKHTSNNGKGNKKSKSKSIKAD